MTILRSHKDTWRRFADEMGGEFADDKVLGRVKHWPIALDCREPHFSDSTSYTRIRVPYLSRDGFRFTIYRENLLSKVRKRLGMQDIDVGYPEFDREFIVKSNDRSKVAAFLQKARIRDLTHALPRIHVGVLKGLDAHAAAARGVEDLAQAAKQLMARALASRRPGIDIWDSDPTSLLEVKVEGEVVTDLARLTSMYDLAVEALNQLCAIGSASDEDPSVILDPA